MLQQNMKKFKMVPRNRAS